MPSSDGATRAGAGILALATALALGLTGACARGRLAGARPDVVLVVVDTLRADHLGAYGYGRATSPHLDALAARGTLFEKAWSAAPWTLPSIMSIMTSRYPSSHRVENDGLRLAPEIPTLAEAMRTGGYATAAFVSHVYVGRPFGFDRGFEVFDDFGIDSPAYRPEARLEPTADRVTDAALSWLAAQGPRPVFLFVHYFDPHWPYEPPEKYRELFPNTYTGPLDAGYDSISRFQDPLVAIPDDFRRFLVDRYDGEIRFVDDQLDRLLLGLRSSGRDSRAWVIVTGDHGEEFKDHGSMGHGRQLYEEVIRVPLLIAGARVGDGGGSPAAAGTSGGRRIATPVSGIDIFPTILDLAGLASPAGLQGISMGPFLGLTGRAVTPPSADRPLVNETVRLNAYRKTVRLGDLKLIHFMDENRGELYDLALDPLEKRDRSAERPLERHRLARALFTEVDLLSGGWNLRWSSDGREHRFQGQVTTDGIFRTIVPMFPERGKYVVEKGNTLSFTDADQIAETGLSFTTAPYEAKVTFYLMVDGAVRVDRVFLGGQRVVPRTLPFTLDGDVKSEAAFLRPAHDSGRDLGFYLWRNPPARPDQAISLDDEIRQRLRSLGYVN